MTNNYNMVFRVMFSPLACIIEHFCTHVLFILFDGLSISRIKKKSDQPL